MVFQKQYLMLSELDRLEKLMPSYAMSMKEISKVLRNKVWGLSEERLLAFVLYSFNNVFDILISVTGEQYSYAEWYAELLFKKSHNYTTHDLSFAFQSLYANLKVLKSQVIVKEQWKQLNPYFKSEFASDDMYEKNIIEILDDAFINTISINPDEFFVKLKDVKYINRGRRGKWHELYDLLPPEIDIAIKYNIINRWNPPNKRYLYLAASNANHSYSSEISFNEFVCLEEMRIKPKEEVTLSQFEVSDIAMNKNLLNIDYEDISREEIMMQAENENKKVTNKILMDLINNGTEFNQQNVKDQIKKHEKSTYINACVLIGKLLLKEICEAIFIPLDDFEDNDPLLKDKCYKSFHIMAEYFESKGISGILYPSTRAKMKKEKGRNLVLFDVSAANPLLNTFKHYISE